MRDVDQLIDDWCTRAVASHPELEAHIDELADHLGCVAAKYTASGFDRSESFSRALEELGDVDQLAKQFRSASRQSQLARNVRCLARTRRAELAVSVAWIVMSLGWAAAMIGVEDSLNWMLAGWILTTFGPLSAIGIWLARREEDANNVADA